jgi:hypothetical protein
MSTLCRGLPVPAPLARPLIGVAAITLAAKIASADVRRARHIRSAFGRGRSERPINAIDPAPGASDIIGSVCI